MKLQPALIFGEHMVLQQGTKIPVWGRSAKNDEVTVELGDARETAIAVNGEWMVTLPAFEACEQTVMRISSKLTGEKIVFEDVAIGEVWLAGGQSNIEFIMKYDFDAPETLKSKDDQDLRYFCFPKTPFLGYLEKEPCSDQGFWRRWEGEENKKMFSAVGAYMGKILREKLDVPVAVIGCNWGGTPASAWTSMEDLKNNEKLKRVLEEYENNCSLIDWRKYIETSERPIPIPTEKQLEFEDRFMMGEDMSEFFKNFENMPRPDISVWSTYPLAPRSATRPAGVYEMMLKRVAPYAIRGVIWYQGEDDDARGWQDFYDESMITMIRCWRKLWGFDFPFYQVELPPFEGVGMTGAKDYALIRHQQAKAAVSLDDVYDVCILDAGEKLNIHPRHKKIVGERLGRIVMKHTYGDESLTADCPIFEKAERKDDEILIRFSNCADGLAEKGNLRDRLFIKSGEKDLDYEYEIRGDVLRMKAQLPVAAVSVEYCETNYCPAVLFNSEGNPLFGFRCEV
ncbi:MAG: hypothetical protein IJU42_08080 [Erysipelotrichaceae bacterium]|nr:hypothetical protein [Erysipelotrichaceae bacterium]